MPEPTSWRFGPPAAVADDLVMVGGDLAPGTLLAAYAAGYFPMPMDLHRPEVGWWSPRERGVLPLAGLRVSRSLRQSARHFKIRVDTSFEQVLAGCADPTREHGWITGEIRQAFLDLHRLGWAHSVEAWRQGELVGGLYGVAIGGLFAGESMFSRARDASKVALVALVSMLSDEYADRRLVDTQWQTPHLASLGVVTMPRPAYLSRLEQALEVPLPAFDPGTLSVLRWTASLTNRPLG